MARLTALFLINLFLWSVPAQADGGRALKKTLESLEQRTGYRFLYRASLVRNREIDFPEHGGLAELIPRLQAIGLTLSVDSTRRVAILTEYHPETRREGPVTVTVVDASSGAGLPFATISWYENSALRGVTSDEHGRFQLADAGGDAALRIGYVGYKTVYVQRSALVDAGAPVISLLPDVVESAALVVSDARYQTSPDSSAERWSKARITGTAGERNVLRSLEAFPGVSPVVGLNRGLVLRGSNPDAFQVLLDGMTIFHQSHLFGLVDAFQSDALQTVAFHYASTPASLPSPPGGLMAFYTRSAGTRRAAGSAGFSNTSFKGLVELPFAGGRGSLLAGGRSSLLNAMPAFGNRELVSFGLDVDRAHSPTGSSGIPVEERMLQNRQTSAHFSDFHLKAGFEAGPRTRLQAAFYAGSDDAAETSDRYFLVNPQSPFFSQRFRLLPVATTNDWMNRSWSVSLQQAGEGALLWSVQAGGSVYRSDYLKGDYVYPLRTQGGQPQQGSVVDTFANKNRVAEFKFNPQADWSPAPGWTLSAGAAAYVYEAGYEETNLQRARPVVIDRRALQFDTYLQSDVKLAFGGLLQTGLRTHYFDAGKRFRLSPRLLFEAPAGGLGSFKAGYSVNYQFLHRFNINQQISADVWSLTGSEEPVTTSGHLFAGWKRTLWNGATLSADVYRKKTENMRLHEISSAVLTDRVLENPRFYNNTGRSSGLELFLDQRLGRHRASLGYVRSHTRLSNPDVNRGETYDAEWDRRHQWKARFEATIGRSIQLHISTTAASGIPNYFALFREQAGPGNRFSDEKERLGWYYRTDAGLTGNWQAGGAVVEATFGLFNVFNRMNPWYRTTVEILEADRSGRIQPAFYPVDVYDLGFRPSFELVVRF